MSRAFVKEGDGEEAGLDLPERALSPHRNLVTAAGLAAIEQALRGAREAVTAARAADDKPALARAERDLRYWSARRGNAEQVPPPRDTSVVRFGCRVTFARGDGSRTRVTIVGEDEADPAAGLVSYVAPLARALLGAEPGDVLRFGDDELEILAIDAG